MSTLCFEVVFCDFSAEVEFHAIQTQDAARAAFVTHHPVLELVVYNAGRDFKPDPRQNHWTVAWSAAQVTWSKRLFVT